MKIFSVSQIRKADEFTIANEPIASFDLMERAARACYDWFHQNISRKENIVIFCGQGNNGGDGLALARMLKLAGFQVRVIVLAHSKRPTKDFQINLQRLKKIQVAVNNVNTVSEIAIAENEVVVDSILGTGLSSPLRGFLRDVVEHLNSTLAYKIAIDIPTGLFADSNHENQLKNVFNADITLTFQFPKWSFLFPEYGFCVGDFEVLDIGLHDDFIRKTKTNNFYIDEAFVRPLFKKRFKFDHKGTYGHALLIAGSEGKAGAAILASRAALKTGAGLVTVQAPTCALLPLQIANPEVMVLHVAGSHFLETIKLDKPYSAIGIGPGIGTENATKKALIDFLKTTSTPVVLDADALNILAEENAWKIIPENSILTPHLGELDRMLGEKLRGEMVYNAARKFAINYKVVLIVKGAHSAIYAPDGNVYFNSSGCNGMATAGSGDVLTGMLTGLIAQGVKPLNAAIIGVYCHGKAGEKAASISGNAAMLASDIITNIRIGD